MDLEFKKLDAKALERLTPLFKLRRNRTCDSVFLGVFLWKDYYNVRYTVSEDKAILWMLTADGEEFATLPMCSEEDLPYFFNQIKDHFNRVLGKPLQVFLADEEAVRILDLSQEQFLVEELEDAKDYLYSGDALRSLSGKKLHKKKNLVNLFRREYGERYEYRRMCCSDEPDIWNFLVKWRDDRGENVEEQLDHEVEGIHEILRNCSLLNVIMGGIYIDGNLEAFTIGSLNSLENMAVIHIEKANPEIKGLYQFLNREFLLHEFPAVELVNREDDMGHPGLRQAKMSYCPLDFARKYRIKQLV